jgi:hypothetical protein
MSEQTKIDIPTDYVRWSEHMNTLNCLVWDQHGYWRKDIKPPEWFTGAAIDSAKAFVATLQPADIALLFEVSADGEHGEWATVDHANTTVYFHNRVKARDPESYMRDRHATHARLYGGVIGALLAYQSTGVACHPDWNTNESDRYGWKDGKQNEIPRTHDVISMHAKEGK